jgi:hypothetical protein
VNAPYVAELTGIVVGEHLEAMHETGVSAPGTPFASPDHAVDLRLLTEATKRRQA